MWRGEWSDLVRPEDNKKINPHVSSRSFTVPSSATTGDKWWRRRRKPSKEVSLVPSSLACNCVVKTWVIFEKISSEIKAIQCQQAPVEEDFFPSVFEKQKTNNSSGVCSAFDGWKIELKEAWNDLQLCNQRSLKIDNSLESLQFTLWVW